MKKLVIRKLQKGNFWNVIKIEGIFLITFQIDWKVIYTVSAIFQRYGSLTLFNQTIIKKYVDKDR